MSKDIVERAKALLDGKFSPDPWQIQEEDEDGYVSEPDTFDGYTIWHDDGEPGVMEICKGFGQGSDEGLGDARFVAAAPGLVRELMAEVERLRRVVADANRRLCDD